MPPDAGSRRLISGCFGTTSATDTELYRAATSDLYSRFRVKLACFVLICPRSNGQNTEVLVDKRNSGSNLRIRRLGVRVSQGARTCPA